MEGNHIAFNQPTISVVMTNKNSARTLERCIESILDQTSVKAMEIVIVDADSKDGSQEIIRKYSDRGVRLIVRPNIPPGPGEMLAAQEAQGEFLATTNPDAYVPSDWLEKCYKRWQLGYDIVGGVKINGGDEYNFAWTTLPSEHPIETILPDMGLTTMSMFIKKSVLLNLPMTNILDSRDVELALRAKSFGIKLIIDPDIQVIHDHPLKSVVGLFRKSASYTTRHMNIVKGLNGRMMIGGKSGVGFSLSQIVSDFLLIEAVRTYFASIPMMEKAGIRINVVMFVALRAVFNMGQFYGFFRGLIGKGVR
jgi:glycosyltransferase involved in cell wall biosynthesis